MIKLNYLQNMRAVKKFVLRSSAGVDGAMGVVKDSLYHTRGELIYQKKLTETSIFGIVSFEDDMMLVAWESLAAMQFGVATQDENQTSEIVEVICSKVLMVTDDVGDNQAAMAKMELVKASLVDDYDAAVLKEEKIADAQYRLLLFFTNEEKMHEFERTFGVKNP